MSTLWLYIPPLILLAALVALVVMLGKKTAILKRKEYLGPVSGRESASRTARRVNWKKIGQGLLSALEKTLFFSKKIFQASEGAIAGWLKQVKEKRSGKKEPPAPGSEKHPEESRVNRSESVVFVSEEKREIDKISDISREVIVKRKAEPLPAIKKEEPAAEDKIKEEALIHRIAENPKDVEAYRELGDYYLATGNIRDAKDSFKMVLRLRPRDLKAKSSLREVEMKMRLGN